MRSLLALAGLGLLCAIACPAQADEAVGRVRAIYYEEAPGVLVDSRFRHRPTAIRWADVDIGGGRSVLAKMSSDVQARIGERVAVRLADPKSTPLAQVLPTVSAARALEAVPESSTGR
jgi:hypothetical protein